MYKIRASHIEQDLESSGLLLAYKGVADGIQFPRFDDQDDGHFSASGGLVGDGTMSLTRFDVTDCVIRLPRADFIGYERTFSGQLGQLADAGQTAAAHGVGSISSPGQFWLHFGGQGAPVSGVAVTMSLESLDSFLETGNERRLSPPLQMVLSSDGLTGRDLPLIGLVQYVLDERRRGDPAFNTRRDRLAVPLLQEMMVQFLVDTGSLVLGSSSTNLDAVIVRKAKQVIQEHYASPITVASVASAVGVSLRSLQKSFRDQGEGTPRQYLSSVRLDRARECLKIGMQGSVTEIACDCGIMHLGRFSLEYRRRFGETPSATFRTARLARGVPG
ncbi:AraC family transcriptional regulator [Pelagibacterium sediminicola]|uniref:AraC family transcriptional regulator n=1 Tax=Pelagibacterium sediminicola TaxID=2248761 RepID=UPI000E3104C0|nr:AraC family transcriptional regulator [Pelagibacterium sediminicola]